MSVTRTVDLRIDMKYAPIPYRMAFNQLEDFKRSDLLDLSYVIYYDGYKEHIYMLSIAKELEMVRYLMTRKNKDKPRLKLVNYLVEIDLTELWVCIPYPFDVKQNPLIDFYDLTGMPDYEGPSRVHKLIGVKFSGRYNVYLQQKIKDLKPKDIIDFNTGITILSRSASF